MHQEEIKPIIVEIEIDQSQRVLNYIWEKLPQRNIKTEYSESYNWSRVLIEAINEAREFIAIKTPYLLHPEIVRALEKSHDRGVRIYILVKELKHHQKFKFGIFRTTRLIKTSYVLIDPKTRRRGFWFDTPVTSKHTPNIFLELSPEHVEELLRHFSHEFWRSSEELFFGKQRRAFEFGENLPDIESTLRLASRILDNSIFSELELDEIIIPELSNLEIDQYYFARKIGVPLSEWSRKIIDSIKDDSDKIIYGKDKISFGFISGTTVDNNRVAYVYHEDIVLLLNEQKFDPWIGFIYVFHREKKIGDINGPIILYEDNWDRKEWRHIKDVHERTINDSQETIEKWFEIYNNIEEYKRNKHDELKSKLYSEKPVLSKKVKFMIEILPPQLPKGAKKHNLYNMWDRFNNIVHDRIKTLIDYIEKLKSEIKEKKIKKTKKIILEQKLDNLKREFHRFLNMDFRKPDKTEILNSLDELAELEKSLRELVGGINKESKDAKITELDTVIKNRYVTKPDSISGSFEELKQRIPYRPLPSVGELWEYQNRSYFVIRYIDEIQRAIEEAKKYGAKVVVSS